MDLDFGFSDVDWEVASWVHGWPGLQFQAWARGSIQVNRKEKVQILLHVCSVLEFWLDGTQYFGGDAYCVRKAPTRLHLHPGHHQLEVRLVRDVRIMGAGRKPRARARIEMHSLSYTAKVRHSQIILPEIVDGVLSSSFGSLTIQNLLDIPLEISGIRCTDVRSLSHFSSKY